MTRSTVLERPKPAVALKEKHKPAALALAGSGDAEPSFRYNLLILWNSGLGKYIVSPGNMLVPNGFGTGTGQWPSPAYLKWYIMPRAGKTVVFNNTVGSQGLDFEDLPPNFTVNYDPTENTASVAWTNSTSVQRSFTYTVNLLEDGVPVIADPDVTEQAPPG
jgi:hypothetical protein